MFSLNWKRSPGLASPTVVAGSAPRVALPPVQLTPTQKAELVNVAPRAARALASVELSRMPTEK